MRRTSGAREKESIKTHGLVYMGGAQRMVTQNGVFSIIAGHHGALKKDQAEESDSTCTTAGRHWL